MSERLNVKDLITVGIFSVILIVLVFVFGMLGYIPIVMLASDFSCINLWNSIYAVFNKSF